MLYRTRWLLAACLLLLSAGCAPRPENKLIGRWQMEPPASIPAMIRSAAGNFEAEFGEEGSFVFLAPLPLGQGEMRTEGSWSVVDSSEEALTIAIEIQDRSQQLRVEWIDDDTMRMKPPTAAIDIPVRFRRVTE